MSGRALLTLVLALPLAVAAGRTVHAAPDCSGERPWVQVQLRAQGWTEAQRRRALVRSAQATDAGQVVAGATGLELGATLGLGAR